MTDRSGTNGRRNRLRLGRRSALAAVVAGAVLALTAAPASAAGNVPATAPLDLWGVGRHRERGGRLRLDGLRRRQLRQRGAVHAVGARGRTSWRSPWARPSRSTASARSRRRPTAPCERWRVGPRRQHWLYLGGDFTTVDSVSDPRGQGQPDHRAQVDPSLERHDRQDGAGHGARRPHALPRRRLHHGQRQGPQACGRGQQRPTAALVAGFKPSLTNKVYAVAAGGGKHLLRRQLHLGQRHGAELPRRGERQRRSADRVALQRDQRHGARPLRHG